MKRFLSFSLYLLFKVMVLIASLTALIPFAKAMAQTGAVEVALEISKKVSIPDGIVAVPCEQIVIPVDVDNAADIAGMDLEIAFDPNILKVVNVEKTDLTESFLIMHEDSGNGTLWISLAYHAGINSGTGALVHLIFEVLSNAMAYDSTEVSIEKVRLYTEEADPIEGIDSRYGKVAIQGQKMDFPAGWSMISLRVVSENASISALFPDAVVVYKYKRDKGYVRVLVNEQLEVGKGYWILFDEDRSYTFTGTGRPIESYNKTLNEDGWEMIGGCTFPAQASADNCNIGVIYSFVRGLGYKRVPGGELLEPGKGFWILFADIVDQCRLTVETNGCL